MSDFVLMLLRRRDESGGCGAMGCFLLLLGIGLVVFLIMRGRQDRREVSGAAHRPMTTGPIQPHTFANPFGKCPNCGAAGDKMKQQWDGLRAVTWTCGYCGHVSVQQLKDEELPPSARQRLGLDGGPEVRGAYPDAPMGGGGSGMGGLLTGMMIGSMMGGGSHHHHGSNGDGWGGSGDSAPSGDWDGGSDSSSSDGGWDSGGDFGGGDSGGDW